MGGEDKEYCGARSDQKKCSPKPIANNGWIEWSTLVIPARHETQIGG
jgi:hypothetical protein